MEVEAEIAALRAEVESLKSQLVVASDQARDGFGPDVGLPITPIGGGGAYGAFRWEDGKITNCRFMFGRSVIHLDDVQDATADGRWSLLIPHAAPQNASVLLNASQSTDLTQTVVPLFQVSNGEIVADWRGMPVVPVRE